MTVDDVDRSAMIFAAMSYYQNSNLSAYHLYYFVMVLATAFDTEIYYWQAVSAEWMKFSELDEADMYTLEDEKTIEYYKSIDSSSKVRLRIYAENGAITMSGTWVKIFNLIPSTDITYTIENGGYLDVTLMTEGLTVLNVHANFGKSQLISKYNSAGFMASDILCSVPVNMGQNEIEQFSNRGVGGEVPYLNNSLSEIELYFSDEWYTILTDLEPWNMTLSFTHQDKKQPAPKNTTKRARMYMGSNLHEK